MLSQFVNDGGKRPRLETIEKEVRGNQIEPLITGPTQQIRMHKKHSFQIRIIQLPFREIEHHPAGVHHGEPGTRKALQTFTQKSTPPLAS